MCAPTSGRDEGDRWRYGQSEGGKKIVPSRTVRNQCPGQRQVKVHTKQVPMRTYVVACQGPVGKR